MSDHHRHTQKVRHHASRRITLRQPRLQMGGAVTSKPKEFIWNHIADPVRATDWNEALRSQEHLKQFGGVITSPNWGGKSEQEKLDLYVQLVECQDDLNRLAISIIYKKIGITDPTIDTLEQEILNKITLIQTNETKWKEYFKDVYRLVTGATEGTLRSALTFTDRDLVVEKIGRLLTDPLAQILIWPERVANMFVEHIAQVLIKLKADPSILGTSPKTPTEQEMFANTYNTYIQAETLYLTSKGLRDGFYIWQEVRDSVIPIDECAYTDMKSCVGGIEGGKSFWQNFYTRWLNNESVSIFSPRIDIFAKNRFSHIIADIFRIYQKQSANDVKAKLFERFSSSKQSTTITTSNFRPDGLSTVTSANAEFMRVLDPEQYTFIFHLLYTMSRLEEAASSE
jgi:hypothetical protein